MVMLRDAEGRSPPARVYPACGNEGGWVVEGPCPDLPARPECRTFTGAGSLVQALAYAHAAYGNAQYMSR